MSVQTHEKENQRQAKRGIQKQWIMDVLVVVNIFQVTMYLFTKPTNYSFFKLMNHK